MKGTASNAPRKGSATRSVLIGLSLSLVATLLAAGVAWVVWSRWYYADADEYEQSALAHIASYDALAPGGTFRIASFPAKERQNEVPTYVVNINRHNFREREFETAPAPGVRRIFAVGDSATFGTGVAEGERFTDVLQELLSSDDPGCCEVLNTGRVGATTQQVLKIVHASVLRWDPSVLIVNGGANDLRVRGHPMALNDSPQVVDRFEDTIRQIVALCRQQDIQVVLWANANADRRFPSLNRIGGALRRIAAEEGLPLVDLIEVVDANPATLDEQRWFLDNAPWTSFNGIELGAAGIPLERAALQTDWIHLNKFGHRRLGEALLPHVRDALARAGTSTPVEDPSDAP